MEDLVTLIGQPESEILEYKAVLPPAKSIAQIIASFANTNGGYLVLGVKETPQKITINGLSSDFHANSVTHKAIDLLTPKPKVEYENRLYDGKRIYVITVEKSVEVISLEGKKYIREGSFSKLQNPIESHQNEKKLQQLKDLESKLEINKTNGTVSKSEFVNHYISIINIADRLSELLYPSSAETPTDNQEGKILTRILYSSCADNFETYLSDLLYEIFLAKPETLKSAQEVTIKEVLDCADIQEFISYWSKKKLSKLQRGSVKGFLSENKQIDKLQVIDKPTQDEIERILQIRHLYAHRNGIVDEKFLKFYPEPYQLNEEHRLSIKDMIRHLNFLADCVVKIDDKAIEKYDLSTIE
ncbi:ATP-binding protein [Kordia sp. TARA_039_SRF]|nr:ATP-binding protein [Kordia sp. TARA_039_SRF]